MNLPRKVKRANSPYLNTLTIGFGIYIIISASFMQQVWRFLNKVWGEKNLSWACVFVYLLLGVSIISYIVKFHFNLPRLIGNITILALSFLFAWRQPYFVEKMHILEYVILGWLATRDLHRIPRTNIVKTILFSILFVLLIGSLDEGFQKLLPYRVGEIRDVITNLISGSFGITLFLSNR